MTAEGRGCVKRENARRVGAQKVTRARKISRYLAYVAEIDVVKMTPKSFHTYMVAPVLPSNQVVNKKVGIAAIHPDFRAAKPLSLMECAGRIP